MTECEQFGEKNEKHSDGSKSVRYPSPPRQSGYCPAAAMK